MKSKPRLSMLRASRGQHGTTLIELIVAMAVFMIISTAAFLLFNQQQSSSITLNGQVGLNLGLRSAVSQLQTDVANAGNGYYQTLNVPSWPVGVTIVNTYTGSACNTGTTYGPTCFDRLSIIVAANATANPPVNPVSAGISTYNSSGTATALVQVPAGFTMAQILAEFQAGNQLLFVSSTPITKIATVVLTTNSTQSGSNVLLTFTSTDANGINTAAGAIDPLDISACNGNYAGNPTGTPPVPSCDTILGGRFTASFASTDWIIKLAPITYLVCAGPGSPTTPYACDQSANSADIQDPKLMRIQNGTASIVMDQILGFRVGANIWNTYQDDTSTTSNPNYNYIASTYNTVSTGTSDPYNFTLVRAIRASIIGRTAPNYQTSYTYRNTFDNGPYQVQGTAVVINPRNMSMNDNSY